MKVVLFIIACAIAIVVLYNWANPTPSPYAGFPPGFQEEMERIDRQVKEDTAGDLGQGAIALCRARLGIKEPIQNGMDLIRRGYGVDKSMAFTDCVVNTMYPDPDPQRHLKTQ
jgi:hypothetical protein